MTVSKSLPVSPPNTTAVSWFILVKVWPLSGGGPSPAQSGLLHKAEGRTNDKHFMTACQSKVKCALTAMFNTV